MFILEQVRELILNLDNVSAIFIDSRATNRTIYVKCNNGDNISIGEYETNSRTKEVLQEIKKAICENVVMFEMPLK